MKTFNQILLYFFVVRSLQIVTPKPIFKGLSFKKNYEMEISAIPFKHISFIKEKWFPFKMIGIKHDIEKREVDPRNDNLYSVNEVIDEDESANYPGLFTNVKQNFDFNSDSEKFQNSAPVIDNSETIHTPVVEPNNVVSGIVHTSSVIPLNPSIIIAPSIQTTGTVVHPAAVVPLKPDVVSSVPIEISAEAVAPSQSPEEEITPIQPMYTHVDVAPIDKVESSISKLHTDISSVVPLNTLVAAPAQEMDFPLPDVKVETPVVETPAVETPVVEIPAVETPVVETPAVETPVVETPAVEIPAVEVPKVVEEIKVEPTAAVQPPVVIPAVEPPILETLGKTGPPGLIMRGTRFVLYFGSVMLQLLSQMLSGSPPPLNQLTTSLTLK